MELFKESCKTCAGDLEPISATQYRCVSCGNVYTHDDVKKHVETLRSALDDMQLQAVTNARKNLYKAVTAKYISSKQVHEWCRELKKHLPDDFQANFYETAISNNGPLITDAINAIDVEENAPYLETAIRFLIVSLKKEYQMATSDLIKRAYEFKDPRKYAVLITELEKEAVKIDELVYETSIGRDVFLAYSSKDRKIAIELMEYLEAQNLSCFFAERNLRHGEGSKENYEKALEEAMDNCGSFVFVSSPNSRNVQCDALKKEIPYIKRRDIEAAPAEFKNVGDYTKIPQKYKKHRVEYRIENSKVPNRADQEVKKFFDGYEWALTKEQVADRIFDHQMALIDVSTSPVQSQTSPNQAAEKTKFCVGCGEECSLTVNSCPKCFGREFADTKGEADMMRENKKLRAEIEAQNLRASQITAASRPVQQSTSNAYNWQRNTNDREYQTLQTARQNAVQMIDTQTREKARLQEAIADAQEKSYKAIKPKSLKRWATFSFVMAILTFVSLVVGGSMAAVPGVLMILVFLALDILVSLKFLKVYRKPRLLIILNIFTYGLFTLILAGIAIHKCNRNKFPQYEKEIQDLNNQLGNVEYRLNTARNSLDEVERKLANLNYR